MFRLQAGWIQHLIIGIIKAWVYTFIIFKNLIFLSWLFNFKGRCSSDGGKSKGVGDWVCNKKSYFSLQDKPASQYMFEAQEMVV